MSGHSKWATIRRAKGANDAKRGQLFTKLSRDIIVAAGEGGGDLEMNFKLRLAVDKAKAANMPNDNIDRAIKKGTGELGGEQISRVTYEAYGPGSSALLIDCQTDNTNRAVSEVKNIVEKSGGKFSSGGGVAWLFEEKGLIVVAPAKFKPSEKYGQEGSYTKVNLEDMQLVIMEIPGVEDITVEDYGGSTMLEVVTERDELRSVHSKIEELGYKVENAELAQLPKDRVDLNAEETDKLEQLVENLEDSDEVSTVWHNANT